MGDFDYKIIINNLPFLWDGLLLSLKLFCIALVGGIFFGTLLALARLSSWRILSYSSAGFVNLIRSIPFIMAIFWFYFLTPMLVGKITGQQGEAVGPFTSAVVAFIMVESAYYSEIIRAGIQSVPRGQPWAAYALGMNYWQASFCSRIHRWFTSSGSRISSAQQVRPGRYLGASSSSTFLWHSCSSSSVSALRAWSNTCKRAWMPAASNHLHTAWGV